MGPNPQDTVVVLARISSTVAIARREEEVLVRLIESGPDPPEFSLEQPLVLEYMAVAATLVVFWLVDPVPAASPLVPYILWALYAIGVV